jgi:hypothetical protein
LHQDQDQENARTRPKDEAGIEDTGAAAAVPAASAAAAAPPASAAVADPPLAGRSLQLRLQLLNQPPAQQEGGGAGW